MARWSGKIGFGTKIEEARGIWKDGPTTERTYYGDTVKSKTRIVQTTGSTVSGINIANDISIVSDNFVIENLGCMRYVTHRGCKWCITSIDDSQRPRLILSIGGVYNGK